MRLRRGMKFTNGKLNYTISGIWYNGTEPVRYELTCEKDGKIYTYKTEDLINAINESKIKEI